MSNIYRYATHIRHFQVPQCITGKLPNLSLEEFRMLLFLHSEFQRTSKSEITLPAKLLSERTGIHITNVGPVRKSLVAEGLLLYRKHGQTFTYLLCDPTTRTHVPDGAGKGEFIDFDSATAAQLYAYFEPHLKQCERTPNRLSACCPFHQDTTPSFSVELKDGNGGRWNCFGCNRKGKLVEFEIQLSGGTIDSQEAHRRVSDCLSRLGVAKRTTGKQDVVYAYMDEEGEVVTETVRPGGRKEDMYRRRPHPDKPGQYISNVSGCPSLLYRLPDVIRAETVIIVEGEPDVERLRSLHLRDDAWSDVAVTTITGGAGACWLPEYTRCLAGKSVFLMGDNDADGKGLKFMQRIGVALADKVKKLKHIVLPEQFKDISDYLNHHSSEDFVELLGEDLELPIQI